MCADRWEGRIVIAGKLITFEGIDGSGKTTQLELLKARLEALGQKVAVVREPGGTALSEQIRDLLLDHGSRNLGWRAEALLFTAARAQLVHEIIIPALKRSEVVLCDRFSASTVAYQGYGRELPPDELIIIQEFAIDHIRPDLIILLDLAVDVAAARLLGSSADRMESVGRAFQERIREGYLKMAKAAPDEWLVVDADQPADGIAFKIASRIEKVLTKDI